MLRPEGFGYPAGQWATNPIRVGSMHSQVQGATEKWMPSALCSPLIGEQAGACTSPVLGRDPACGTSGHHGNLGTSFHTTFHYAQLCTSRPWATACPGPALPCPGLQGLHSRLTLQPPCMGHTGALAPWSRRREPGVWSFPAKGQWAANVTHRATGQQPHT